MIRGRLSGRDSKYGTISSISGVGEHNTLANYFDGDDLDLDRLAKDGIFAPNMTLEQVKLARKSGQRKMATGIPPQIMKPKRKTSAGVLRTLWRICANECEFGKIKIWY